MNLERIHESWTRKKTARASTSLKIADSQDSIVLACGKLKWLYLVSSFTLEMALVYRTLQESGTARKKTTLRLSVVSFVMYINHV